MTGEIRTRAAWLDRAESEGLTLATAHVPPSPITRIAREWVSGYSGLASGTLDRVHRTPILRAPDAQHAPECSLDMQRQSAPDGDGVLPDPAERARNGAFSGHLPPRKTGLGVGAGRIGPRAPVGSVTPAR